MRYEKQKKAFTLTEVLISAGILAIGFMLIAGAFPVGVKLTSLATERTIGSVATQEAIAKIKIHGLDMSQWNTYFSNSIDGLSYGNCFDYSEIIRLDRLNIIDPFFSNYLSIMPKDECYYPSTNLVAQADKKYHWSALCRRISPFANDVEVTIFVSRLGGAGIQYPGNPIPTPANHDQDPLNYQVKPAPSQQNYPEPYMIQLLEMVDPTVDPTEKTLIIPAGYETYFREGAVILDDITGQIFTIQERLNAGQQIVLDRKWHTYVAGNIYNVWVIPSAIKTLGIGATPPTLGGRWPCVWVFQDKIKF